MSAKIKPDRVGSDWVDEVGIGMGHSLPTVNQDKEVLTSNCATST